MAWAYRKKINFKAKGAKVTAAVETAIDIGYRHIDTAAVYENEKLIGVAIKKKISQGILKREDLFITTKVVDYILHLFCPLVHSNSA